MPDDEEECREATVEETRILEFKLIVNHRLADLMDKMGIEEKSKISLLDAIFHYSNLEVFQKKYFEKWSNLFDGTEQRYETINQKIENEWREKFQNKEMFKGIPNYLNSIRRNLPKQAEYCQYKAVNYLLRYADAAILLEKYRKEESGKKQIAVHAGEDDSDEIIAFYKTIMNKMEKYLDTIISVGCVPLYMNSLMKLPGFSESLRRLPKIEAIVLRAKNKKTASKTTKTRSVMHPDHKAFEDGIDLLIRRIYSNPFSSGDIDSNMLNRKRRTESAMELLNKVRETKEEITEEAMMQYRLFVYIKELYLLEYRYVTEQKTKYLELIFNSQRKSRQLCIQMLDADYTWLQQFKTGSKTFEVLDITPPDLIDIDNLELPKDLLAEMTEAAINLIVKMVEFLPGLQPDFRLAPISKKRLQFARSQGIETDWQHAQLQRNKAECIKLQGPEIFNIDPEIFHESYPRLVNLICCRAGVEHHRRPLTAAQETEILKKKIMAQFDSCKTGPIAGPSDIKVKPEDGEREHATEKKKETTVLEQLLSNEKKYNPCKRRRSPSPPSVQPASETQLHSEKPDTKNKQSFSLVMRDLTRRGAPPFPSCHLPLKLWPHLNWGNANRATTLPTQFRVHRQYQKVDLKPTNKTDNTLPSQQVPEDQSSASQQQTESPDVRVSDLEIKKIQNVIPEQDVMKPNEPVAAQTPFQHLPSWECAFDQLQLEEQSGSVAVVSPSKRSLTNTHTSTMNRLTDSRMACVPDSVLTPTLSNLDASDQQADSAPQALGHKNRNDL